MVHVGFSLALVAAEIIRCFMQMLEAIFEVMHSFGNVGVLVFLGPHELQFIGSRRPVPDNDVNGDHAALGEGRRRNQSQ